MINMSRINDFLNRLMRDLMVLSILILACAIVFFALSLSTFTIQLSLIRRDMPKTLDRIDRQIAEVKVIAASLETVGNEFSGGLNKDISAGINKGISEGVVDLPINTVANVGKKITSTAVTTGKTTYGFWQVIRDKIVFWHPKTAQEPSDLSRPKDLPAIGKWMIAPDGKPADWLGIKYQGKEMREPINIVIIDEKSQSPDEAIERLIKYCEEAGYKNRKGHSSGYSGFIDKSLYGQIPQEKDHAFSNRPYEMNNDHGRIFGPYEKDGKFYFIGAFSREVVGPVGLELTHKHASFKQARDDFANNLDKKTGLKISARVFLDNRISGGALTTGDHDGFAIILKN